MIGGHFAKVVHHYEHFDYRAVRVKERLKHIEKKVKPRNKVYENEKSLIDIEKTQR